MALLGVVMTDSDWSVTSNSVTWFRAAHRLIKNELSNLIDDEEPQTKNDDTHPTDNDQQQNDDDKKGDKLPGLAEDGELDKSVAYIEKTSQQVIGKLYTEYERKR